MAAGKPFRWIWLIAALPLAFAAIGGWMLIDGALFQRAAATASGEVIALDTRPGSPSSKFIPTFRYRDAHGDVHEGRSHMASTQHNFAIGERVEILYDIRNPAVVRVHGASVQWGLPILFIIAGLIGFFGLAFSIKRSERRNRS